MHIDPMQNWRSLTENYAQMSDGELLAIAEDFGDLTDMARQVLRDEMRKRNLGDPQSVESSASNATDAQGNSYYGEQADSDAASAEEFVWKSVLAECYGREEAWQISEVLRRAGIESWLNATPWYLPASSETSPPRQRIDVLVAGDRLYEARAVLSHPIPPDIVEESKAEGAIYRPPTCPACGAPDPILESNDSANSWKCEVCGRKWTDTVETGAETPRQS